MRTVGIVAEYNPFHKGHLYHLEEAKSRAGAECSVVVMSGNFTQRGTPALLDKFTRAEAAVRCGADLVLELPLVFSVASAERFAAGGVSILSRFADALSFGAECEDASAYVSVAEFLTSSAGKDAIREGLHKGLSYPAALEKAASRLSPEEKKLLSEPNAILGIEYVKAIGKLPSPLPFLPIGRIGSPHNAKTPPDGYSASSLRSLPPKELAAFLPEASADVLLREAEKGRVLSDLSLYQAEMTSFLRRMTEREWQNVAGVSEGIENRILAAVKKTADPEEAVSLANSGRYPSSRIRRIMLSAYLGISRERIAAFPEPKYARVLAFTSKGRSLLASRKDSGFPLIVNGSRTRSLPKDLYQEFQREAAADDLYYMAFPLASARESGTAYVKKPYIAQ